MIIAGAPTVHGQLSAQWANRTGGLTHDYGYKLAIGPAGELYQTGTFEGSVAFGNVTLISRGLRDGFIARYDSTGNLLWVRQIGGPAADFPLSVAADAVGNVLVCGYFSDSCQIGNTWFNSAGEEDIFLCKYEADGSLVWAKSAGTNLADKATGIVADSMNGGFFTGYCYDTLQLDNQVLQHPNPGSPALVLARFDETGNFTWARTSGASTYGGIKDTSLSLDKDGNCLVAGFFYEIVYFDSLSVGSLNLWAGNSFLVKFNPAGQAIWAKWFGSPFGDLTNMVKTDAMGNAYVSGRFFNSWRVVDNQNPTSNLFWASGSYQSGFLAKFSPSGEFKWVTGSQPYSPNDIGDSEYFDLQVTPEGTSYITGFYVGHLRFGSHVVYNNYNGYDDALAASFDSSGSPRWAFGYATGRYNSHGYGLALGPGNSLYLTGYFADTAQFEPGFTLTSAGGADAFLARFNMPLVSATPAQLLQNLAPWVYPNPSSGSFKVVFPESLARQAQLQLFDSHGKWVLRQKVNAGSHEVSVHDNGLASGFYLWQVSDGNQLWQGRLIIIQ